MTRTGFVTEICGDFVTVILTDASCDACTTPCGACRRKSAPQTEKVENILGAAVGDRVEVSCPSGAVVLYSILLFLLPIVVAIAVSLLLLNPLGEVRAPLFGALGALVAFLLGAVLCSTPSARRKNAVSLTRILPGTAPEKELDKP